VAIDVIEESDFTVFHLQVPPIHDDDLNRFVELHTDCLFAPLSPLEITREPAAFWASSGAPIVWAAENRQAQTWRTGDQ